jgi:hypothetical protein
MEHQNITLSLPKDLIKQAKHLAVERGTSLSGLLSDYLIQIVRTDQARQSAFQRMKKRLEQGLELGTNGRCSWKREDLHER